MIAAEKSGIGLYVAKAQRARNAQWPRYVFIHINKTAGSSIERALNLRFEHKTALEKREELGSRRWQRSFKFAFVRNPWTRALSHYQFRVQTNQTDLGNRHLSFPEWVRAVYSDRDPRYRDQELMFQSQWYWISNETGDCLVDFIGRFESLQNDYANLCRVLGVSAPLPHMKRSAPDKSATQYDAETRDIVGRYFRVDVERFRYAFPFPMQCEPLVRTGHARL